jgi:hypothetical protein
MPLPIQKLASIFVFHIKGAKGIQVKIEALRQNQQRSKETGNCG